MLAKAVFWGSLGALGWTHVGYPLLAATLARLRPRPVRDDDVEPRVVVIVAAHDEEAVIARRVANLRALDYPADRLEIVVASDGSTDRTDELAAAAGARVVRNRRAGKVAAQDAAVRRTDAEVVAFSDANTDWAPDALRRLVRAFADPEVAYVCGRHFYEPAAGTNREGLYARYEGALRAWESRFGSVTAGVGPIYAVRRADYVELDPRYGHDLALPYLLVRSGRRAVVEEGAVAWERPARDIGDEYRRKVRMFEHCWLILLEGGMLRGQRPLYALQVVSHRHLRYASGMLHLALLASSIRAARGALVAELALLGAAAARPGVARYYALVTWATVPALVNYLRRGVPATWAPAAGTR